MGIDPVTHKPFSQILADYGNIGCIPKYGTRIGSLTRDLKNAFISRPEPHPSPPEGIPNINSQLATTTALMQPKVELIQECFLNYTSNNININDANTNPDPSLDLFDQLQAIKLATEASRCADYEKIAAHFLNEGSLSSSASSSSTCSTAAQENSALNFSWRDFLLEDAFLPSDHHPQEQEIDNAMNLSSKNDLTSQGQNVVIPQGETANARDNRQVRVEGMDLAMPSTSSFQVQSSSHTSFVEAMLNQENEIFLDFPNLLEEQFSY
ncbi:hypothetical protein RCOM_1512980 [Ricinus communis]|uniref:Uncharacterized protein n=2 Tax=Ricinus communis TaxID=3988 RepID=B9R914_RICCO|nr:hypothetical protein RCOM_1512980 [Ricinus communis]